MNKNIKWILLLLFAIVGGNACLFAQTPHYVGLHVESIASDRIRVTVSNENAIAAPTQAAWWDIGEGQVYLNPINYPFMDNGTSFELFVGTQPQRYITFQLVGVHYDGEGWEYSHTVSIQFVNIFGSLFNSLMTQIVLYPTGDISKEDAGNAIELFSEFKKSVSIGYSNGLGKAIQSIAKRATSTTGDPATQSKDVITHIEYDDFGLQSKSYLPFQAEQNTGDYRQSAKSDQSDFYSPTNPSHPGVTKDDRPYSETVAEESPLLRPEKSSAVGNAWRPGQTTERTVRTSFGTNMASDVLRWEIIRNSSGDDVLTLDNARRYYDPSTLTKTIVKDEDDKQAIVFKDKSDKEVCKRSSFSGQPVETHYVYDDLGNLRFIIPPQAIKEMIDNGGNWTSTLHSKWVTEYRYDGLNRQIGKHSPEEEVVTTVYDKLGRVVMRQDGKFRANNSWLVTKYDKFSRVIITGMFRDDRVRTRDQWQAFFDGRSVEYEVRTRSNVGYTLSTYPHISEIWTITYYDDYDFDYDPSHSDDVSLIDDGFPSDDYDGSTEALPPPPAPQVRPYPDYWITGHKQFNRIKDKVTKTRVEVVEPLPSVVIAVGDYNYCPPNPSVQYYEGNGFRLLPGFCTTLGQTIRIGPATGDAPLGAGQIKWNESVSFYDKYGRVIQTQSKNHLGGTDRASTQYDFSGKVLRTKLTHMVGTANQVVVNQRFTYDHAGRPILAYQRNNNDPEVIVSKLEYNELGQVVRKKLHSTDGTNFLQTMDYKYNIRGWLESVNDPYSLAPHPSPDYRNDLFGFKLLYNADDQAPRVLGISPKFNGNISAMVWASAQPPNGQGVNAYKYTYDDLSRLSYADPHVYFSGAWDGSERCTEGPITYDLNGNINALWRTDYLGRSIDALHYAYDPQRGNRLAKVEDTAEDAGAGGFTDGAHQENEYLYDANGNMIEDKNKGITVQYNYFNLPTLVHWSDGRKIEWLYDGTGAKLRMSAYGATGELEEETDYVGGFEYKKVGSGPLALAHFAMAEGRVIHGTSGFEYEYFMKDHLGNVRLSFQKGANGFAAKTQEDWYYPFGLRQAFTLPGEGNKYLYNGKELVDKFGLQWYHYGARYYDPQIARWIEMDPADEFHSPYLYVDNDPVRLIDPDGKQVWGEAMQQYRDRRDAYARGHGEEFDKGYRSGQIMAMKFSAALYGGIAAWQFVPLFLESKLITDIGIASYGTLSYLGFRALDVLGARSGKLFNLSINISLPFRLNVFRYGDILPAKESQFWGIKLGPSASQWFTRNLYALKSDWKPDLSNVSLSLGRIEPGTIFNLSITAPQYDATAGGVLRIGLAPQILINSGLVEPSF